MPDKIVIFPSALQDRFEESERVEASPSGRLWRVVEKETGKKGAIKLIAKSGLGDTSEVERLKREFEKQQKVNARTSLSAAKPSRPGTIPPGAMLADLATPIDSGDAGEFLWVFRDWYDGGISLEEHLSLQTKLSFEEAAAIGAQVAGALDKLHRAGLMHRDVKPRHILILPVQSPSLPGAPQVALIDAGVTDRLDSGGLFPVLGTPAYIAPEVAAGSPTSFRSDLYSLGCVFFEMVTGRAPFDPSDTQSCLHAHATEDFPALPYDAPSSFTRLLGSMVAKQPSKRPLSARQVQQSLRPLLRQLLRGSPPGGTLAGTSAPGSYSRTVQQQGSAPKTPAGSSSPVSGRGSQRGMRTVMGNALEEVASTASSERDAAHAHGLPGSEIPAATKTAEPSRPGTKDADTAAMADSDAGTIANKPSSKPGQNVPTSVPPPPPPESLRPAAPARSAASSSWRPAAQNDEAGREAGILPPPGADQVPEGSGKKRGDIKRTLMMNAFAIPGDRPPGAMSESGKPDGTEEIDLPGEDTEDGFEDVRLKRSQPPEDLVAKNSSASKGEKSDVSGLTRLTESVAPAARELSKSVKSKLEDPKVRNLVVVGGIAVFLLGFCVLSSIVIALISLFKGG